MKKSKEVLILIVSLFLLLIMSLFVEEYLPQQKFKNTKVIRVEIDGEIKKLKFEEPKK